MNKTTPFLLSLALLTASALAQSAAKGTVLVKADFSNDVVDKAIFGITSWNIPETWEQRDGALASIYDPKQHSGKAHGTSISPRIKARDVRISYRVKFEDESALGLRFHCFKATFWAEAMVPKGFFLTGAA